MIAVVLYHVWPRWVPGGYIGVDVFFVLSGYLITSHLLREIATTGTVSLGGFWARRIRRLMPASFLVLAASAAAAVALLPQPLWAQNLTEVRAATLYIENWLLAANSVDYLAAENAPSVVQHFWSLSVEEQFYVAWPILLLCALWLASRVGVARVASVRYLLLGIVAISLPLGIVLSYTLPGPAYFITPTRVWEFAAGGVLAAVPGVAARIGGTAVRAALSWLGVVLIVGAAMSFSGSTVFPGWAALVPVLGTLAVIAAGQIDSPYSPTFYGRTRIVQWTGDISYSIYLWHWPVLIVLPYLLPTVTVWARAGVVVVTVLLAWGTKVLVEDPVRNGRWWVATQRRAFVLLGAGMAVLVVATTVGLMVITARQAAAQAQAERVLNCLGVVALEPSEDCVDVVPDDALFPDIAALQDDLRYQYNCYTARDTQLKTCTYGDEDSQVRIAIVGDSHAASLIPGLMGAAEARGWAVTTFVGTGCTLGFSASCKAADEMTQQVAGGAFDIVLATGARDYQPDVSELVDTWGPLVADGVRIVPIVDVPQSSQAALDCVASSEGVFDRAVACSTSRDEATGRVPDGFGQAASILGLDVIDITDVVCAAEVCPSVLGHVIVYRDDSSHVTATFSRSLGPLLGNRIGALLP